MAEWCDVNHVCVRQAYDADGRRTLRWENVPEGAGMGRRRDKRNRGLGLSRPAEQSDLERHHRDRVARAQVRRQLRRRHYDGFGQLTQEQRPAQGWYYHAFAACGASVAPLPEVDIDYLYDGLGRQIWASVPHVTTADWITDPAARVLGRRLHAHAVRCPGPSDGDNRLPNGEATTTAYSGRDVRLRGLGATATPTRCCNGRRPTSRATCAMCGPPTAAGEHCV